MSHQGQRRRAKTQRRKGKCVNWRASWRKAPYRRREGERGPVDEDGCFFMGSSTHGTSMCSRRRIDHLMAPVTTAGEPYHCCTNRGCSANV